MLVDEETEKAYQEDDNHDIDDMAVLHYI